MLFEFYVPKLKQKHATLLLDLIIAFVEHLGLKMGGGFSETDPSEPDPKFPIDTEEVIDGKETT